MFLAPIAMLSVAIFFAFIVWLVYKKFWVKINPQLEEAMEMLTGLNCGACGFSSCESFAKAVSGGEKAQCPMLDKDKMLKLYNVLGIKGSELTTKKAIVLCKGTDRDKKFYAHYKGIESCHAASLNSAYQGCSYGCLGFGDCSKVCPVSAISIKDGLAVIDMDSCIGCGLCVKECSRGIIKLIDYNGNFIVNVACSNQDGILEVKEVCKVGCIGCSLCAKLSSDGSFKMKDKLAEVDFSSVDLSKEEDYKNIASKCPMHTIDIEYSKQKAGI